VCTCPVGGKIPDRAQRCRPHLLGRNLPQHVDVVAAQLVEEFLGSGGGPLVGRGVDDCVILETGALDDRAMKKALCRFGGKERANGRTSGGLSEDRHIVRVAAECLDVLRNPAERRDPVQHAEVRPDVGVGQKSESAQAIVDRDHGDAAAG